MKGIRLVYFDALKLFDIYLVIWGIASVNNTGFKVESGWYHEDTSFVFH